MYLTDLKAGRAPRYGLVPYAFYIAFFPQVLAGPLVRWSEVMHQLGERPYLRPDAAERVARGLMLLTAGLAKKVFIGDPLAEYVNPIFANAAAGKAITVVEAWQAVLGFTLERMVDDDGQVWQEAVVCDGSRIVLWHGEDVSDDQFPEGAMTSAVRTVPLRRVTEVGYRTVLVREGDGHHVQGVDVYVLLESLDEATAFDRDGETGTSIRHEAIRLGKSADVGGGGQVARLASFAQLIARLAGVPLT